MTNLKRLAALLPLSVVFIAPAISGAQQHAPIAEQIGKAYGVDSFGQVEAIRYTFNIPAFKLSRTWVWEPKTDTVSYEGTDKEGKPVKVTYKRDELQQPKRCRKERNRSGVRQRSLHFALPAARQLRPTIHTVESSLDKAYTVVTPGPIFDFDTSSSFSMW